MATQTQVSVEEYLRTSFAGADCEFVDGKIVERNVGGNQHNTAQGRLIEFFYGLRKSHPLYARPELRFKLAEGQFRVADVAVFEGEPPIDEAPSKAPLIVIESSPVMTATRRLFRSWMSTADGGSNTSGSWTRICERFTATVIQG